MPTVSVAIVEDHVLTAEGLRLAFRQAGHAPEIWSPEELIRRLRHALPDSLTIGVDVVLLDLQLGQGIHGITLIEPITQVGAAVVVCTAATSPVRLGECVASGAAGVLSKTSTSEEVIAAVEAAAGGRPVMAASQIDEWVATFRQHRCEEKRRLAPFATLTPRECEILGLILDGLSAAGIARQGQVSIKTVRHQIAAVLQKLGVNSQLEATAFAVQAGWAPPLSPARG